jgi:phage-related protein
MAGKSASIMVKILGDDSGFGKSMKDAESKLASFSGKMKDAGKSMMKGGALMSAGVTLPIVAMGTKAVQAFAEAEQAQAQLDASLKSTGATAWTSSGQMDTLAKSMQDKLGIDGDLIKSGASVLLTFTNVQNRVGEGKDIFDRTTQAAADMSAKLGTDLSSANMMLGKALNDPIKGMGVLKKAGVQLSEAQREQVTSFMDVGDIASAQAVILGELETQFGGSAEAAGNTAAGGMEKLRLKFEDIQESIGERLVPILEKLGGWLQKGMDVWDRLGEKGQTVALIMAGVAAAIGPVVTVVGALVTAVGFLLSPVGLVVAVLAALAAGLVFLYKNNEGFRAWVHSVATSLRETLAKAFQYVQEVVIPALGEAFQWVKDNVFPVIMQAVEDLKPVLKDLEAAFQDVVTFVQAALPAMGRVIATVASAIAAVFEWLSPVISVVWDAIVGMIRAAIQVIRGVIRTVTAAIKGDWGGVWNGIKGILAGVWNGIKALVTGAVNVVRVVISGAWNAVKSLTSSAFNGVRSAISGAMNGALGIVRGIIDKITGVFRGLVDAASRALSGLASAVSAPFRAAGNAIKAAWNATVGGKGFTIPDFPGIPNRGQRIEIPRLHSGGYAGGLKANEVPAILEAGESVRTRRQEAALQSILAQANAVGGTGGSQVHVHFHGPVAQDSVRWVTDQVEEAVRKGVAMPRLKAAVRT